MRNWFPDFLLLAVYWEAGFLSKHNMDLPYRKDCMARRYPKSRFYQYRSFASWICICASVVVALLVKISRIS